ncbi:MULTISPECIES: cobalamin biosynthesis protein CobW [unclassified Ectothiorhodospira]|uniref:cobalamin biosynthesis protein CobW n=1 Tax=unclassified Ectothiorhodospira TaxID=2684909 RepID=UPI001EE86729|nr:MULTISPECIES: cobalamin biosynthesis protein CobW [unclassified Ectothiorhodospira]MCG5516682.1 cobalamin biosynthesis protein CobW [Ectothiorhodospira sp. 9100]MCG5519940.1 cobalamin biosynthesis protein CobW [Ectothiorhodospira sp. 9905]
MTSRSKIPATIVTGFLGSGKTTLLRHLLENAQGRRIAVIVNEFGELGMDGEILKGCGIGCDETGEDAGTLYELANGCLCCTVQEAFYPVMKALMERRDEIDHILIETSGLALPKPLVQAFNWPEIKTGCTVDAVVTVVDVPATAQGQFAANPEAVDRQRRSDPNLDHASTLHELFEDQLSAADIVVLSKTDRVDGAAVERVSELVRSEIPPQVKIVSSDHGRVDPALMMGLGSASEAHIHLRAGHHDHAHGDGDHHHDHDHDQFDSVVVRLPQVDRDRLLEQLQQLVRDHRIFRVKGFAALPEKRMRLVVHGVGSRFDSYFDRPWRTEEERSTRLVVIGQDLSVDALEQALQPAVLAATA